MKNKSKKVKDNSGKLFITLSAISFMLVAIVVGQFFLLNTIPSSNQTINGISLSADKKNVAEQLTNLFSEKADDFNLRLSYKDLSWELDKSDFVINSDIHTIIDIALTRNLETDTYEKQKDIIAKYDNSNPSELSVAFNYIFVGLDEKLDKIIEEIEYPATDSQIIFHPDNTNNMFEITPEEPGIKVDRDLLYEEINRQFENNNQLNISIPVIQTTSEITSEYNHSLTNKISEFSTSVGDSTGGRKHNVKLALSKFNGMCIEPNESISFNKVTSPHTLANGYETATIIYNSRFIDGVGGGICQASTTLYNALLKANLQIDEVNKHTLPVKYVPLATDAMIAEYISDLKFTNNTQYPIYIHTFSDSSSVSVELYSHSLEDGITYSVRSETIKTINHNGDIIKPDVNSEYTDKVLFKGEYYRLSYPRSGFEAKSYLQKYKNGELLDEKEIRHEIYQPQSGIIIEGIQNPPQNLNPINDNVTLLPSGDSTSTTSINSENMQELIPTYICP